MEHLVADGLVIRTRDIGTDRYLTLVTADMGRITLLSKGSHSLRSEQRAISQLYTYGNYEFYRRGDFYVLKGGSVNHSFHSLSRDMDRLNLSAYFCDVGYELTDEGEPASEMLRLLLNALYAIDEGRYSSTLVKAVFELRAAFSAGYAPTLEMCAVCRCEGQKTEYLDVMNGALLCADCFRKLQEKPVAPTDYDDLREARIIVRITPAVHAALTYVSRAPLARLLAFELADGEDTRLFESLAETYLLSHLGHGFDTLDFYHTMRKL